MKSLNGDDKLHYKGMNRYNASTVRMIIQIYIIILIFSFYVYYY